MPKLRQVDQVHYVFRCPGCGVNHMFRTAAGEGLTAWSWNGSMDSPTVAPSILVQSGHFAPGRSGEQCWCTYNREHPEDPASFTCYRCHSFVRDGKTQFLDDCSHALAGQTVQIPEWED